jgi:hypothetical protein
LSVSVALFANNERNAEWPVNCETRHWDWRVLFGMDDVDREGAKGKRRGSQVPKADSASGTGEDLRRSPGIREACEAEADSITLRRGRHTLD